MYHKIVLCFMWILGCLAASVQTHAHTVPGYFWLCHWAEESS